MFYYTAFRVQDILSIREYYNFLIKKILLPIHHKICASLYSPTISVLSVFGLILYPFCLLCCETVFYSLFEPQCPKTKEMKFNLGMLNM